MTALLVIAGVLIALHLIRAYTGAPGELRFDLGVDRGYGERFQYLQTATAVGFALVLAVRRRASVYLAWATAIAVLLLDDVFLWHERFGFACQRRFPQFGTAAIHVGEAVWIGSLGCLLLVFVVITHRRAKPADQAVSIAVGCCFAALVLTGVVIDAIHAPLIGSSPLDLPLTAIEDGGEIIAMCFLLTLLYAVLFQHHVPVLPRPLRRFVIRRPTAG